MGTFPPWFHAWASPPSASAAVPSRSGSHGYTSQQRTAAAVQQRFSAGAVQLANANCWVSMRPISDPLQALHFSLISTTLLGFYPVLPFNKRHHCTFHQSFWRAVTGRQLSTTRRQRSRNESAAPRVSSNGRSMTRWFRSKPWEKPKVMVGLCWGYPIFTMIVLTIG